MKHIFAGLVLAAGLVTSGSASQSKGLGSCKAARADRDFLDCLVISSLEGDFPG